MFITCPTAMQLVSTPQALKHLTLTLRMQQTRRGMQMREAPGTSSDVARAIDQKPMSNRMMETMSKFIPCYTANLSRSPTPSKRM